MRARIAAALFFLGALLTYVECKRRHMRRTKLPTYLCFYYEDAQDHELHKYLGYSLELLGAKFPGDGELVESILAFQKHERKAWRKPDNYHTTLLYVGGNKSQTETDIYKNFIPGVKDNVNISTFLIIPNKIIAAVIELPKGIETQNQCAHMTTAVGEWKAVASNNVLETLFTDGGPLVAEYDDGDFFKADELQIDKYVLPVKGMGDEPQNIYLVKRDQFLTLAGETKAIF
eukprot:TRINITY_DN374_c0_g1_i1.p1 TRINITY_DN374_c0_g1~~TRINITY_DN374_c0_g1_i1.p1  ORF type:complete len:231 (+),score=70.20 TRINITY_DN374_c0_g1_i1:121-813(+)